MIAGLSRHAHTRLCGFFYFMVVLTGIFSLMYVPSQVFQLDDPAQTVANIQDKAFLFRMGIVSSLFCYTFFLLLGWSLYALLHQVNRNHAIVMDGLFMADLF